MEVGQRVETPRFLSVRIEEVFESVKKAEDAGYKETTHSNYNNYEILGKIISTNKMQFAAAKK